MKKGKILVLLLAFVMTLSSVTACNKPKEVNVSFVVDSQITSTMKTTAGSSVELPSNPTKTGYTFGGWFLDEGTWQNEFTANTSVTKDMSVYAKFSLTEFVATFVADGETVGTRTFTISDTALTDVPEVPVKKGYVGSWEQYTLGTENITVNAQYVIDMNGIVAEEVNGNLLNDLVNNFLHNGKDSLSTYLPVKMDGKEKDYSKPVAVELSWANNTGTEISEYVVYVSESEDFANALTYTVADTKVAIKNLKAGTEYFWKVVAGEVESIVNTFVTEKNAPRLIDVDGITNFRDLGGYATGEGTSIPQGLVYRCATVDNITEEGKAAVKELGIKTEIDLRSTSENGGKVTGDSSILGEDVNYVFCPIGYSAINWSLEITEDKKQALQNVFDVLADSNNYPVVFHCSAGADRTGFIAYALKAILGVNEEEIVEDYLLTNFSKQNLTEPRYVSGLSKFTGMVKEQAGATLPEQMENYLKNVWGVSAQSIASIKANLTANINVSDWNTYEEPTTFAYSIKVYKDDVESTQEFTLPEMTATAYSIKDISVWAMANTPEDYELDLNSSVLKKRIDGNNTVEFAVHYLAVKSDSGELIANITSSFKFTGTEAIVADATWSDFGNIKYGLANLSRSDYVDISEYRGLTLKITIPNDSYYGLVFYDENKTANKDDATWHYKNNSATAGFIHVVEIKIPVTATYVRATYYYENGAYGDSVAAKPFSARIYKSTKENITSLFKFTGTEAIVADATWSDFGNIKYGLANLSRSDYVDISEYRGLTLKITVPNDSYYGLVFYDENKTANKENASWYYKNNSASAGYVHVVEIKIPTTATYVRATYYYKNGAYADSVTATPFSAFVYEPEPKTQEDLSSQFAFVRGGIITQQYAGTPGNINTNSALKEYLASNQYVDVSEYQGKTLKITMIVNSYYGLAFYDKDKVCISSKTVKASETLTLGQVVVKEYEIPEGAVYIRTTYWDSTYTTEPYLFGNAALATPFSAIVLLGEQTEVQ